VYPITPEKDELLLREDCEEPPASPYGRSKWTQERLIRDYCRGRCPAAILRPSSVYGAGNTSRTLLPIFVENARAGRPVELSGSRAYVQHFVHVDDVTFAATHAALSGKDGTFNIFSDETLSVRRLAERVIRHFESSSPIRDAQDDSNYPRVRFDNSKFV